MNNKALFLMILLLFSTSQTMNADNKVSNPKQEWDDENERSLPSVPTLSIDEQNLYIRSSVELTNLDVCIRDSYGNIVYSSTLAIQAGGTAMIPVASFNEGEYTLFINEGSMYLGNNIYRYVNNEVYPFCTLKLSSAINLSANELYESDYGNQIIRSDVADRTGDVEEF